MALDKDILAGLIITKLTAAGFGANDKSRDVWAAIAEAIIEHIKKDAQVVGKDSMSGAIAGKIT